MIQRLALAWLGSTWSTIGWVVLGTVLMYVSALVAIRVAGRRTLTQLSAFDVIVTVALGTLVGSAAVSRDPSYAQGMAALVTLLVLQTIVALLRQRSSLVRRMMDFRPIDLFHDGGYDLRTSPWTAQLTPEEIDSKLRSKGIMTLEDVDRIILESNGAISVVRKGEKLDLGPTGGR